jgi:hypothetical protein
MNAVTENLYDRDYVQQHGFGFERFAAYITVHPERAYLKPASPRRHPETAREWRDTGLRRWFIRTPRNRYGDDTAEPRSRC